MLRSVSAALRTIRAAVAVILVVAGVTVSLAARANADGQRKIAVCSGLACLYVVDLTTDSDGDGVTDIDEEAAGTDPHDAASYPPVLDLVKRLLGRELPSFERHQTELVVLPTLAPDGTALETGLGEFDLRDGDAALLDSIADITASFNRNGFEDVMALHAAVEKDRVSAALYDDLFDPNNEIAWVSSGTSGWTSYGTFPPERLGGNGGGGHVELERISGNRGMTMVDYRVEYRDGAYDKVTQSKNEDTGKWTGFVLSYDRDGNLTKSLYLETSTKDNPDGSTTKTILIDEKFYKDGSQTVRYQTTTKVTTYSDGSTVTEINSKSWDANGKFIGESTVVQSDCNPAKANCVDGETVDKQVDPDYVEFVISDEDEMAAVERRMWAVAQPTPDAGEVPPVEPGSRPEFEWNPETHFALAALYDPDDGTTVFFTTGGSLTVGFDPLGGDYHPDLALLYESAGQPQPKYDGGTATWPS